MPLAPALPAMDRIDLYAPPLAGAILHWGEEGPALLRRLPVEPRVVEQRAREFALERPVGRRLQGRRVDIRVSTVPTVHGESIVMRLLPKERIAALSFLAGDRNPVVSTIVDQVQGMRLIPASAEAVRTALMRTHARCRPRASRAAAS